MAVEEVEVLLEVGGFDADRGVEMTILQMHIVSFSTTVIRIFMGAFSHLSGFHQQYSTEGDDGIWFGWVLVGQSS